MNRIEKQLSNIKSGFQIIHENDLEIHFLSCLTYDSEK